MEAIFGKKYKFEASQNFASYMEAIGISPLMRKIAQGMPIYFELREEGDDYIIRSVTPFQDILVRFTSGIEFEQRTIDDKIYKTTITVDGNTLHETQKYGNGVTATVDWVFCEEQMKMVMKVGDIVATRIYRAFNDE
ncbi:hypothetical protein ILUMI_22565 [Ignelater luminosus]|uniref:Uncharacterized protein n=1 Tax=Ignelater luminosus TaxID=2038154 RepID=A0A8K0CAD8_IGNLU|nr:hypothetical protein ILUMI_22565 [Ignelater luminosus]